MSNWFTDFIEYIDDYTWLVALVLIVVFGCMFIYIIRFSSFRIRECFHVLKNSKSSNGISVVGSFFMALSTRMGAGNIIGVAMAIIVGGVGSIFWMWIFAFFGAALCFAECTLGQIFKTKIGDGLFRGGPAFYINKGLKNPKLALFFAFLFVFIGMLFGGVEACNLNQSIVLLAPDSIIWVNSLIIALAVFFVVTLGLKKISKILSILVPIIASIWVIIVIITVLGHYEAIPSAFGQIISHGLNFQSFSGAVVGVLIITGFKRGAFCSEGGTGLISAVSSSSDDSHPCIQGYSQSLGVYVDIFIICTATALLLITCGGAVPESGNDAIKYIAGALSMGFLGDFGASFVALVLIVVTFGTTVGTFLFAESSSKYMFEESRSLQIKLGLVFAVIVFVMSMQKLDFIWQFADFLIAAIVVCNILIMIRLRKYVEVANDDYTKKRGKGIDSPEMTILDFGDLDTSGITEWCEKASADKTDDLL